MNTSEPQDDMKRLANASEALARVMERESSHLADEARSLADHLRHRQFEVAVVGEFNRGKSTLVNTLVGHQVLPTGVLPVTAVVTEVVNGDEAATVTYLDGRQTTITLDDLATYVTEERNPGNLRKVAAVRVSVPTSLLGPGVTLVDTPGLGSVFRHGRAATFDRISHADGIVMVLAAEVPLADVERSLLQRLRERPTRTHYVLNRSDLLDSDDIDRVRWFVESVLREVTGERKEVLCVSTRTGEGLDDLRESLSSLMGDELDRSRQAVARHDLGRLADRIDNDCALQEAAAALSLGEIDDRLGRFRQAAGWHEEAFVDDRTLFEHATERLLENLADQRPNVADDEIDVAMEQLAKVAQDLPADQVAEHLARAVEEQSRALVEPLRRQMETDIDSQWRRVAERFERATRRRAEKLHGLAGDLFNVELHALSLPTLVAEQAPTAGSSAKRQDYEGEVAWILRPFVSAARRRQRQQHAAERHLVDGVKAQLGGLQMVMQQRIQEANTTLEHDLRKQVQEVVQAMTSAIERAKEIKTAAHDERRHTQERLSRLRAAAATAREATAGESATGGQKAAHAQVIDLTDVGTKAPNTKAGNAKPGKAGVGKAGKRNARYS